MVTAKAGCLHGFRKIQKNQPKEDTEHDEITDPKERKGATFFLQRPFKHWHITKKVNK